MVRDLPSGTVTFLFTDVEGSTRLLEALGAERYAEALAEHRAIVRDALAAHDGVEVDTQGDAFFCAFASVRSAVACAGEIGEALSGTPIRVRIGIHTGEALLADRHYVGMDVHRAARIGACAHGGQVVLSPSTVALLEPGAFPLVDLGEHRLKDLSAPVRLHQLGTGEFPRLNTLFRTNLPVPATPFLGRDEELRDLVERASEPGLHVLTLTGPGGTGKTRLSLQLAAEISEEYPDGVWWVPLAPLGDGSLVASALASGLDVEEESGRDLASSLGAALGQTKTLLLLDNCEHLVASVAELVSAIVAACPRVLVLATSREALAVSGEHVYPVQPLAETDAVALFYARARAAGADLDEAGSGEVVHTLCGRLDNLPLAVELAAARAAALPPVALLQRLSSGLDVLKGPRDVEERQRTLRATISWSYGLLEESEQELFRRLSVFVGGATLAAVEEVCEADLDDLLSLVAKSLVRQRADGDEPRYWMLETIREFAHDVLDASGGRRALQHRHMQVFARLAGEFRLVSEGPPAADSGESLARVERDLANLRAAFRFAVESDQAGDSVSVAMALWISHQARGRYSEAEDVVRRALALDPEPLAASWLHEALGRVLRIQGRPTEALEAYEASERAVEKIVERGAEWWERWLELQMSRATLFYFENMQDDLASLVRELEPLVDEHGTEGQRVELLHLRTQQAYRLERYVPSHATEELARQAYERAVENGEVGADFMLGFCLLWRGKLDEAEECFSRGRSTARARGLALVETRCLVYGSIARRRQNDLEGTRAWVRELEAQEELHGYRGLTAANGAWVALRDGDLDSAAARADEAFADWYANASQGSPFEWTARFPLLAVALASGQVDEAREHGRAMLDESLQPLPDGLREALSEAVESGSRESLEGVLGLAAHLGYA